MRILSAIKKELLEIAHDRTMLLVLAAFPVFIMLFMGSSFGSLEILGLPVGVVGPTNTTFASVLFADLGQSTAFNLQSFHSEAAAMEEFRNGKLRAIIIVPQDFENALMSGEGTEVRIAIDNSDIALQEAILAAMSSVVQASSTNITRTYVSSAWNELYELNDSASSLAEEIARSREGMRQTQENLVGIQEGLGEFDIGGLEGSLESASFEIAMLQEAVLLQNDSGIISESEGFLYNASFAVNESIDTVGETYDRLDSQSSALNNTATTLGISIAGLELLKNSTADPVTIATLDLNILSLQFMKNNTLQQMVDADAQADELHDLNGTLRSFRDSLDLYSMELGRAKESQSAALAGLSASLDGLNASFSGARDDIGQLKGLFAGINTTASGINETLGEALEQTDDVNNLIASLYDTVAVQTGKDPETIAAPLSVKIENQYSRNSFVDFIIPQVIAISILFSCFLLAAISLVREKTEKTIIRLLMIPRALANVVVAKILAITFISLGQVMIILLIGIAVFAVALPADPLMLVIGTMISALVLSAIGVLIGFYARTESAAIQTSLLIAIPMLFLGNIIFSPDLLPSYTRALLELLPLAHITNIFKVVLITGGDPMTDIMMLVTYFVLLAAVIGIIVFKRRDITNYV
ncbi:MAG: ABC transporter permease [Candidatus Micrarchaeota archaeon]